ncbi:MAG: UvrD-helicase domain-containing protein, partial [Fibrobacter sp.]|nr:UvrD-helicase domain-containing protein [Fibrobacter sp.]
LQSKTWGDLLKRYVEKICDLAEKWQGKYEGYKQQHHLMDFNDIELQFKELLSKEQVKGDIKDRYRLVMVDEFQDCNPLQVEIFDILSELVKESVWVGDKKQSIYGFRGSDMQLINAVIAKFPEPKADPTEDGLHSDTLEYSYRSRKKLVEMANDIFVPVFAPDPSVSLIPKRVVAGQDDLDNVIGNTPVAYDWHSESSNADGYYADVAAQIKAVIDGKAEPVQYVEKFKFGEDGNYDVAERKIGNVSPGDIAVLARKGTDVDKMVAALAKIGVPVNAVEHDIKDFGEIQLLMAMLNYSLHRNNYSKAQILYLWDDKTVPEIIKDRIEGNEWIGIDWNKTGVKSIDILKDLDEVLESAKGQSVLQLVETLLLRMDIWNHVAKWGNVARRHANINTFLRIV